MNVNTFTNLVIGFCVGLVSVEGREVSKGRVGAGTGERVSGGVEDRRQVDGHSEGWLKAVADTYRCEICIIRPFDCAQGRLCWRVTFAFFRRRTRLWRTSANMGIFYQIIGQKSRKKFIPQRREGAKRRILDRIYRINRMGFAAF